MPRATHDPPHPNLKRLGKALRALRKKRGLKQIEVATAAGMKESQLSAIENAKNNPGWVLLTKLLEDGLDASLADLLAAYEEEKA